MEMLAKIANSICWKIYSNFIEFDCKIISTDPWKKQYQTVILKTFSCVCQNLTVKYREIIIYILVKMYFSFFFFLQ